MKQDLPSANFSRTAETPAGPQAVLRLRDAVALIIGVVIGAGVFKAPSMVAGMTGSPEWMFAAWILGGLISLVGALCYAELSTAYSHTGGDYHFLYRAYGRSIAFLYAWARFSVITTGSIALLGFVFGDYMTQVLPLGGVTPALSSAIYAAISISVLSWVNLRGIHTGASTQTWLTLLEVIGLLAIVATALYLLGAGEAHSTVATLDAPTGNDAPGLPAAFGLAMVFVLLTYGGWNEAAYISAELKDGRHNMVKALVFSILIITGLYLLVNWSYWTGLGMEGMRDSSAIAASLLSVAFGPAGEKIISVMVAIAALTSINATMIVGARTSYAAGRDWPVLSGLGKWDTKRGTPINAMLIQGFAALLLVFIGALAGGGFKAMVEFTAPVFWLFFLLAGLSLFVLRWREPHTERPFKVPLYPVLPIIFCATCLYMLWASLSYVYSQSLGGLNAAWIGVAVLAIGLILLTLVHKHPAQARPSSLVE
jgi:APA family basic amino acid/polyamine antiporter